MVFEEFDLSVGVVKAVVIAAAFAVLVVSVAGQLELFEIMVGYFVQENFDERCWRCWTALVFRKR